jgi:hypothetical protein
MQNVMELWASGFLCRDRAAKFLTKQAGATANRDDAEHSSDSSRQRAVCCWMSTGQSDNADRLSKTGQAGRIAGLRKAPATNGHRHQNEVNNSTPVKEPCLVSKYLVKKNGASILPEKPTKASNFYTNMRLGLILTAFS